MSTRLSSPVLVGREEELATLARELDRLANGNRSTLLLAGPAGMGKTRLVGELERLGRERDVLVLGCSCPPLREGAVAYAALAELVRALMDRLPAVDARRVIGEAAAELAVLVPGIGEQRPRASDGSGLVPAVLGVLERALQRQPLALVVEDAHWIDASTAAVVAQLAHGLRSAAVLLVVSYRSEEAGAARALRELLVVLSREPAPIRIDLAPLSPAQMVQQMTAILGAEPEPGLATALGERAEGIPLYVEELLANGDAAAMPLTLREAVLLRLDGLAEPARRLLELAALAGRRVQHDLLSAAFAGEDVVLEQALHDALRAGLLERDGDDVYGFRHALVRDAIASELLSSERRRVHRVLALLIEDDPGLAGPGPGAREGALARHWLAAGDRMRALPVSLAAAEIAELTGAHAEAAEHLEHALDLWGDVADASSVAGCEHVDVLRRAAEATYLAGDAVRAEALGTSALAALREQDLRLEAALALERIGRYRWSGSDLPGSREAYDEALVTLPDEAPAAVRARVLAGVAQIAMLESQHDTAIRHARAAIELALAVGDREDEGRARTTLGTSLASLGHLDEGLAELERGRAIGEQLALHDDTARANLNASFVLEEAGRPREALGMARAALAGVSATGMSASYGCAQAAVAANALVALGAHAEALELIAHWLRHATLPVSEIRLRTSRGHALTELGRLPEAEQALGRARSLIGGLVDLNHLVPLLLREAELALWAGDPAAAGGAVSAALDVIEDTADQSQTAAALELAWRVAAEHGGAADVARLDRVRQGLAASPSAEWPAAQAALALADAERSRLTESSVAAWTRAARELDALPRRFAAGYARLRGAEAMLAANDRPAATTAIRCVLDEARTLGAGRLLAEAQALARRARLSDQEERVRLPAGLTDREIQVLDLLAEGRTNRQIASELFISEKTASVHVSNILRKLGVQNRGEAAAARRSLRADS